jgi:hypothetical protein
MIQGRDISVVVQGPIVGRRGDAAVPQSTRDAIESARRVWPGCELILSTWKGAAIEGLDYDELVLNDDPGAVPLNDTTHRHLYNNLNRQIVSTRNGLARATRPYAIKLRSDTLLLEPLDFSVLDRGERLPEFRLLEKPVIALHLVTRHPLRRPVLFHLSDLFHAGLREDVVRLWSLPLAEEPSFSRALDPNRMPAVTPFPETDYLMRCAPEQYLAEQLTRRRFPQLHLRHPGDGTTEDLFLWLRVLSARPAWRCLNTSDATPTGGIYSSRHIVPGSKSGRDQTCRRPRARSRHSASACCASPFVRRRFAAPAGNACSGASFARQPDA